MNSFRPWLGIAALAASACLALSGCGGSSGSTDASGAGATPTASSAATSTSFAAFESCLKAHGVKTGGFGSGTRPFSTASPRPHPSGTFTRRPGGFTGANSAAFKACEKYAPAGFGRGFGNFGNGFRGISASALAAFKSCMSQNGVKVTGTTAQQIFRSLRNATGKIATADKTCRVLLQPSASTTPSPST
jgi:hypothetical protein